LFARGAIVAFSGWIRISLLDGSPTGFDIVEMVAGRLLAAR